jgi:hypothetical protein
MRKFAVMLAAVVAVSAPSLAEAKGKPKAAKQTVQEDPNARFGHALSDLAISLSQPTAAAKPGKEAKGKQAKAKPAKASKKG